MAISQIAQILTLDRTFFLSAVSYAGLLNGNPTTRPSDRLCQRGASGQLTIRPEARQIFDACRTTFDKIG